MAAQFAFMPREKIGIRFSLLSKKYSPRKSARSRRRRSRDSTARLSIPSSNCLRFSRTSNATAAASTESARLPVLVWSAVFAFTFSYPFHWDDFHLIRQYSGPEMRSVFHGVVDPDKIETPGLRPVSILLYNLQGTLWGENILLNRIFMHLLMA